MASLTGPYLSQKNTREYTPVPYLDIFCLKYHLISHLVTDAPRCAQSQPALVWASVGSVNDVICKVINTQGSLLYYCIHLTL